MRFIKIEIENKHMFECTPDYDDVVVENYL